MKITNSPLSAQPSPLIDLYRLHFIHDGIGALQTNLPSSFQKFVSQTSEQLKNAVKRFLPEDPYQKIYARPVPVELQNKPTKKQFILYCGFLKDVGFHSKFRIPKTFEEVFGYDIADDLAGVLLGHLKVHSWQQDWIEQNSLVVKFPVEVKEIVEAYQDQIESAATFEEAVNFLKELAIDLQCIQTPHELHLFHKTKVSPKIIEDQGLFSPRGYEERFGEPPPNMVGQMSGDGICTTAQPKWDQSESNNFQYQITLQHPTVMKHSKLSLTLIHWYIKLRHDFGLPVYKSDAFVSHDIIAKMCNRLCGLSAIHKDLGIDVFETEFEHLIRAKHVAGDKIALVEKLSNNPTKTSVCQADMLKL